MNNDEDLFSWYDQLWAVWPCFDEFSRSSTIVMLRTPFVKFNKIFFMKKKDYGLFSRSFICFYWESQHWCVNRKALSVDRILLHKFRTWILHERLRQNSFALQFHIVRSSLCLDRAKILGEYELFFLLIRFSNEEQWENDFSLLFPYDNLLENEQKRTNGENQRTRENEREKEEILWLGFS